MKSEHQKIEDLKEWLGEYKSQVLGITEEGFYNYNGKLVPHFYILPIDKVDKNIIDSTVMPNISDVKKHTLFSHLNSSQALCLNLFGPLDAEHIFLLNPLLGFDVKDCIRTRFEFVDDLIHDRSNFDFFIETKKHERLYFEIKYTESTIHTTCEAKNLDKRWKDKYSKPMEFILKDKDSIAPDVFYKQYQLWRNICRVANNHCEVYFVLPDFRETLKEEVKAAKKLLKPELRNRVHILTIDSICDTILNTAEEKYQKHYKEFKNKYFPSSIFDEENK